jgi:hypothetical protein
MTLGLRDPFATGRIHRRGPSPNDPVDNVGMPTRIRLLVAAIVVAGLGAQAGIAYLLWQAHTARQPKVTADVPYMDQAILAVVTGAGDTAAVAVSGIVQAATCQLDLITQGGQFTRTADMYTDPGSEDALVSRIASRLPTEYHAHRPTVPAGQIAPLLADVGHGVQLAVRRLGEGWVVASARTGCTSDAGSQPAAGSRNDTSAATITALLSTLGTRAAEAHQQILACPAGGSLVTLTEISEPTATDHLLDRLAAHIPAKAHVYAASVNRVAYHDGPSSVIIAASDDATEITIRHTTRC